MGGKRQAPAAVPQGKTRYPLYRRTGRPQGRSGRVRKISPLPGFDPRTVQLVTNLYTDWAIPAHPSLHVTHKLFPFSYTNTQCDICLPHNNILCECRSTHCHGPGRSPCPLHKLPRTGKSPWLVVYNASRSAAGSTRVQPLPSALGCSARCKTRCPTL